MNGRSDPVMALADKRRIVAAEAKRARRRAKLRAETDETLHFRCHGCGKDEYVSRAAYENGDTGWYVENEKEGSGVCGGSQWCLP